MATRLEPWGRPAAQGEAERDFAPRRPGDDGSETGSITMIDLFAWIVLIVLAASTVAVIVFLAMLPGMIVRVTVIRRVLLRQVAILNYINPF